MVIAHSKTRWLRFQGRQCIGVQSPLALLLLFLFLSAGVSTLKGQEPVTRDEFWPEVDVYINVKPKFRLFLLGTISKSVEDGELFNAQSYEAQVGAHVDYIPMQLP